MDVCLNISEEIACQVWTFCNAVKHLFYTKLTTANFVLLHSVKLSQNMRLFECFKIDCLSGLDVLQGRFFFPFCTKQCTKLCTEQQTSYCCIHFYFTKICIPYFPDIPGKGLSLKCSKSIASQIWNYSRLSLSQIPRDSLRYFEISVSRHIRFAELRKNKSNNHI